MSGPEPFDVSDDLAPHIAFFMCIGGFFFGQPISRAIASRHFDRVGGFSRVEHRFQPTRTDHMLVQTHTLYEAGLPCLKSERVSGIKVELVGSATHKAEISN